MWGADERDPILFGIYLIAFIAVGLCMGSFASAIAARTVQGTSWIGTRTEGAARSLCPACGHILSWYELIPLLSWICQRGRCRACQEPISPVYPLLEVFGGGVAAGFFAVFGVSWGLFINIAFLPFHLAFFVMAFLHRCVPPRYLRLYGAACVLVILITYGVNI